MSRLFNNFLTYVELVQSGNGSIEVEHGISLVTSTRKYWNYDHKITRLGLHEKTGSTIFKREQAA